MTTDTLHIATNSEQVAQPTAPTKPAFFAWSIFLQAKEGQVGSTFAHSFRDFGEVNKTLGKLLAEMPLRKFYIGLNYTDGVGCMFEVTMSKEEFDSGMLLEKVLLSQIMYSLNHSIFSADRANMAEILTRCNNDEPRIIFD